MKILWLSRAIANRQHQILYIAENDARAAVAVGDAIDAAIRQLADYPASGRQGRVQGTRELIVAGTPFVLVYRVDREAVRIMRLLHGAQKWPPRRKR